MATPVALAPSLPGSADEEKFRKVKLANPKISQAPRQAKQMNHEARVSRQGKALSCPGAEELLLAAGFKKTAEHLEAALSGRKRRLSLHAWSLDTRSRQRGQRSR